MARPMIIASALTIFLVAACTRAPSGAAPGESAPAAQPSASAAPATHPGVPVPVPDSRAPQPAPDSAPPGPPPTTPVHPVGSSGSSAESSQATDSVQIAALERAAVALAKTTGCTRDDQCRNAPVGVKACGGPQYYIKYCAASTDSVALFRALARLDSAERAYNAKYRIMSTCQMILPTRPHLVARACH